MYRDYRDKVQFFYVYKSVEHPEVNNFVSAFNIEERLKHIAIAKERFRSDIPWICDTMENDVKMAFGGAPNGEFVLDPNGKIVRKRFWSNPQTLRADLEELIGPVDKITKVDELPAVFTPEPSHIASGVVAPIEKPAGLMALNLNPIPDKDNPFFAKLRVEANRGLQTGNGKMLFSVYLDPIYRVHWNNRAGKVKIEVKTDDLISIEPATMISAEIAEDADIDPRQFVVDAVTVGEPSPIRVKVTYTVCDDAETFCKEITQEYQVNFQPDRNLGTRPGIFLNEMFANVRQLDKNGDGNLTPDELPPGKVSLYVGHMDYNGNQVIEKSEIDRFLKMFNNGRGVDEFNDGNGPIDLPLIPNRSSKEERSSDNSDSEPPTGER